MTIDLSGNIALITGASRGIGRAIAEAFAAAGARVVLASRTQETLDVVADGIRAAGGEALAVAAHTGDRAAVNALVERAVAAYGGLDVVVNNAATNPHFGPMLTADEGQWQKLLDVNLLGYVRVAQAALPHLRTRGGGKIINVASIAGRTPLPGMGAYCVSKAAVLMLSEVLAVELAPINIQVNALVPGFVKTRFSRAIWDDERFNEATLATIPQGRMAEVDELTAAALYLASPLSVYMTGTALTLDGGQLAGGLSLGIRANTRT